MPVQAVEERALLGRLDGSKPLTDLQQELASLQQSMQVLDLDPAQVKAMKKQFSKRESDIKKAIRDEQRRIAEVKRSCKELFAKGGGNVLKATDKHGRTLLMLVASLGLDDATQMVLADNPPLDAADKNGLTALEYEMESGGTVLQKLVDRRWTQAIMTGNASEAEMLLDSGASTSQVVDGEPPLAVAIRMGYGDLVALLVVSEANPVARSKEGFTMLELAVRMDRPDAVSQLLGAGADDGACFSNGATPLFFLSTMGSTRCFETYISTSSHVDMDTLPCCITRVGSVEKIRLVVKAQNVNKPDAHGNIPIHEAARRGDPVVFKLLLDMGGSRTALGPDGESTLMHAALSGNEDVVRMALEGLDAKALNMKDKKGCSAISYAKRSANPGVVKLLEAAGLTLKK